MPTIIVNMSRSCGVIIGFHDVHQRSRFDVGIESAIVVARCSTESVSDSLRILSDVASASSKFALGHVLTTDTACDEKHNVQSRRLSRGNPIDSQIIASRRMISNKPQRRLFAGHTGSGPIGLPFGVFLSGAEP